MIRYSVFLSGRKVVFWLRNPSADNTILMLHGLRGTHHGLIDLAEYFTDYRIILPDLPGAGESAPLLIAATPRAYVAWIDQFVHVLGISQYAILGHSYGAAIALAHSALGAKPPDALVAVTPAPVRKRFFPGRPPQKLPSSLLRLWMLNPYVDRVIANILIKTVTGDRKRALIARSRSDLSTIDPQTVFDQFRSLTELNLEKYVSRIQRPVLVIAGSRDILAPPARVINLARHLAQGAVVVMPNQGHLAPIEDPAGVAALANAFLRRRWRPVGT
jgi:pimeloyl-ACP methyl ester carboxylesterase